MKRVLVAVEDKYTARPLVAAMLARRWPMNTVFRTIHVLEPPPPVNLPPSYWESLKRYRALMEISLKEIADRLQNSVPSSISTAEILEGSPKQEIVVAAERLNADLIIMGSHGRRGLSRLLMGSVSRSVASQAHCSVWIIIPQSGIFENEIPQKQKSTSAV